MSNKYYAEISWKDNTPSSILFDDVYYCEASGIEESNYVFIQHNQLEERFAKLQDNETFIIGETGFGSGLNFLNVLNLWQKTITCNAKLFFISFERYPLSPTDLKTINSNLPNFEELDKQYYLPFEATHRLSFKHNVYLNLVIGDVNETLKQQNFLTDAWFLDGFTPTRNSEMWTETVFMQIARLSKTGTTFATYTASSAVRKNLQGTGFYVNTAKGFHKRNMLYGYLMQQAQTSQKLLCSKPWFARYTNNKSPRIIIIGGGISGAATAYSLAKRKYQVTLYEQNEQLSKAASGNYQAMLYGSFSAYKNPILELSFSGYRYSHYLIEQLLSLEKEEYAKCGLIQLGFSSKEIKSQSDLILSSIPDDFCHKIDKNKIEQLAGIKVNYDSGLYFPYGLWLNPQALVKKLLDLPNIQVILEQKIDEIEQNGNWQLIHNGKVIDSANSIVLCNSDSADKFDITKNLTLRKIRGQISIADDNNIDISSNHINANNIHTILCGSGYITPKRGNKYTFGATFNFKNLHTNITLNDHLQNIQTAKTISNIFGHINVENLTGQAAIRASTYDYMPIVGPLAKYAQFKITYAKLAKDKNIRLDHPCEYHTGLYLNAAHGSKGMLTAPICGEIIADYIDNTPMPCSESLRIALHPNRLYVKELVKSRFNT